MDKKAILRAIKSLSKERSFYAQLYRVLSNKSHDSEEYLEWLEDKDIQSEEELVLAIECEC